MNKRYAIVRVDNNWCPFYSDNEFKVSGFCENRFTCQNCRYGDTKEQLVLKVSQALKMAYEERTGNYGYSLKFYEPMAKFIVEFLGVE